MPLETLVSLGSLVAVGLALYAAMRGFRTELRTEIADTRTALSADIASTNTRIDTLTTRVDETNTRIDSLTTRADGTNTRIDSLGSRIDDLRTELKADIAETRADLKSDISRLDERTFLLATGLQPRLAPSTPPE